MKVRKLIWLAIFGSCWLQGWVEASANNEMSHSLTRNNYPGCTAGKAVKANICTKPSLLLMTTQTLTTTLPTTTVTIDDGENDTNSSEYDDVPLPPFNRQASDIFCQQPDSGSGLVMQKLLLICSAAYGRWDHRPCGDSANQVAEIGRFVSEQRRNLTCDSGVIVTPEIATQCDGKMACNISFAQLATLPRPNCSITASPYVEIAYICITASSYQETKRYMPDRIANRTEQATTLKMAQQRGVTMTSAVNSLYPLNQMARSASEQALLPLVTTANVVAVASSSTSKKTVEPPATTTMTAPTTPVVLISTQKSTTTTLSPLPTKTTTTIEMSTATTVASTNTSHVGVRGHNSTTAENNNWDESARQVEASTKMVVAASIGGAVALILCALAVAVVIFLVRRRRKMAAAEKMLPGGKLVSGGAMPIPETGVGSGSLPRRYRRRNGSLAPSRASTPYSISNKFYTISEKQFDRFVPLSAHQQQFPPNAGNNNSNNDRYRKGPPSAQSRFSAPSFLPIVPEVPSGPDEAYGIEVEALERNCRIGSQSSGLYCDIGDLEVPVGSRTEPVVSGVEYANSPSRENSSDSIPNSSGPQSAGGRAGVIEGDDDFLSTGGTTMSTCGTSIDEQDIDIGTLGSAIAIDGCYYHAQSLTKPILNNNSWPEPEKIVPPARLKVAPSSYQQRIELKGLVHDYANGHLTKSSPPSAVTESSSTLSQNREIPGKNGNDGREGDLYKNVYTGTPLGPAPALPQPEPQQQQQQPAPISPFIFHQRSRWQFVGDE